MIETIIVRTYSVSPDLVRGSPVLTIKTDKMRRKYYGSGLIASFITAYGDQRPPFVAVIEDLQTPTGGEFQKFRKVVKP